MRLLDCCLIWSRAYSALTSVVTRHGDVEHPFKQDRRASASRERVVFNFTFPDQLTGDGIEGVGISRNVREVRVVSSGPPASRCPGPIEIATRTADVSENAQ